MPLSYFRLIVMKSIQQVRADFARPGTVTRKRKADEDELAVEVIALGEMTVFEQKGFGVEATAAIEMVPDAAAVLAKAPEPIRRALRLIQHKHVDM